MSNVLPSHCDRCGAALDKVLGSNGALLGVRGCANCYRDYEARMVPRTLTGAYGGMVSTFDRKEFLRCDTCKESPCECLQRLQQRAVGRGIPTARLSVEAELESERRRHPLLTSSSRKAYIVDESTVSFDDANGTRPVAGVVCGPVTEYGKVDVAIGGSTFTFRSEPQDTIRQAPSDIPTCETCGAIAMHWEILNGKTACVHCWKRYAQDNAEMSSRRGNMLADRCQTLEDDNRNLLAENATLRRRVEKLERKR